MPSVALRLRADGDGDGYADIWRSEDDAFASIANYLRDAGWKPNLPWGVPVSVPGNLNRAAIRSAVKAAALPGGLQPPQPLADRCANGGRWASFRPTAGFRTMRWRS